MLQPNISLLKPEAWSGIWTALVTPLQQTSSGMVIDLSSLQNLIEFQISKGISGLVIGGSTGEGSLLGVGMYEQLLVEVKRIVGKRVPLVAGLGIGGTEACLTNAKIAKQWGYDGILASPPAYIKAPQRGLVSHYKRIAAEGLPICLYEIPGRAASSIEVQTLKALVNGNDAAAKYFVSTKDATGNIERARHTKELCGAKLALLSGDDGTFAPFVEAGGIGVISVASHILPKSMKKILTLGMAGKKEQASQEQERINPLVDALFWESNPIPVKSLLAKMGLIKQAHFCDPLCEMQSEKLDKLVQLSKTIGDAV